MLNVASNVSKHDGPDAVDIEIVAFGPGLNLLKRQNPNAYRAQAQRLWKQAKEKPAVSLH